MAKANRGKYKRWAKAERVASFMPPLYHTLPGKSFDIAESEVVRWLLEQPEIVQTVFERAKDRGAIEFDEDTGKWVGVNHDAS